MTKFNSTHAFIILAVTVILGSVLYVGIDYSALIHSNYEAHTLNKI